MSQGIAILLISALLPLGGITEDLGLDETEVTLADQGTVQVADDGSLAAETDAATLTISTEVVEAEVAERQVHAEVRYLGPGELIAAPGYTLTLEQEASTLENSDPSTSHPSQEASQAPVQGATDLVAELVAGQGAAAAAVAALAVVHAQPSAWSPSTLVRRLSPFLASLYSRITPDDVLDHETRAAAYELLRKQPGLSLGEIAQELEAARSTVRHHVRKLEEAGMVRHVTEGRCRIHYPTGREEEAVTEHLLRNPKRARIVELLETRPLSLVELAHVMEANPGSVHFHLNKLTQAGLVERHENGSVVYRRPG